VEDEEISSLYFFVQVTGAKNKMSRGEEIRFVGGKYIGYTGWKNLDGNETALSIAVIVNGYRDKNGSTSNKTTTVRKESVRSKAQTAPRSRAEAIMQQHPEIEKTLQKFARQLATCELNPRSTSIQQIFVTALQDATARQIAKGNKANWKRVVYNNRDASVDI
jgi:metal-responsive CopG/Arc/MetJ family transcriptional regulator